MDISVSEEICAKWNKPVEEASCNICRDQCELSVADPENFIARKLIVDLERVISNRQRHNLDEDPANDVDFLKSEIEDTFRERADLLIDNLGLAHIKIDEKENEKEEI